MLNENEVVDILKQESIYGFVRLNKLMNEKNNPIDWVRHKFLFDIYDDWTPVQACIKASQIGFSTMVILKALFAARNKKYNIIYCVDEKTEVLTENGFKKYDKIKIGEKILTLGMDGKVNWSPVEEVFSKVADVKMYRYKSRNFDAWATYNHRWIVKRRYSNKYEINISEDLHKKERFIPKFAHSPKKKKSYKDEYVELLSWIFSEGYYVKNQGNGIRNTTDNSIIITQSERVNKKYCEAIRDCLDANDVKWKEYYQKQNGCISFRFAFRLGEKIKKNFPDKIPTAEFARRLTTKQAKIFIETFVKADGWIDKSGTMAISQKNKKCIDILAMISVLGGYSPSIIPPGKNGAYTLRMTQFDYVYTNELKPIISNEKMRVWCPRTEIGTFYARRNGRCYWTGNTLPTGGDVNEFVSSKVNKIIDNNYALQQLVKDKDTIFQKQLGDSVIFFKGTATGKSAEKKTESHTGIMITSDLNIHDESDRSDQVIMEQFESRLDFSEYKGRWYFSNPTVPKVGAHKHFLMSDQKHWFHRCSKCNKRFFLEWTDSCIDRDKEIYLCPKCHQPLSDEDRNKGEWIQKYRNKDISGYWINQMMASWKSCADLLRKEKESSKGHFMNFCLGLPYIGSDMVVNREIIVNNIVLTDNKKKNVAIGVDNGVIKHYVIGNEEGIFAIGKTKDWDEIERLRNLYDAKMVIDALPYPRRPKELSEKYKFKIFLNFYKRDKDDLKTIRWGERQNHNLVYSDRTKIFDEVIAQLVAGKIVFNLTVYQLEEFIEHWERMYLAKTVDSMGLERMSWESSSDEDHYCLDGNSKVLTAGGYKKIKNIKISEEVLTTKGFKRVYWAGLTQSAVKTKTLYLSNGKRLIGTGNHKIKKKGLWVVIDDVKCYDIIESEENYFQLCRQKYIKELSSDDGQIVKTGQTEFIIFPLVIILRKVFDDYIKKFGKMYLEKFLAVVRFIIETAIRKITQLKIWNVYQEEDINQSMQKSYLKTVNIEKNKSCIWRRFVSYLIFGEKQKKVKNGIQNMQRRHWCWISKGILSVLSVILLVIQKAEMAVNSVVKDVVIVGMHENGDERNVYNLSVEDQHEYFASSVLVSNCHATIYFYLALQKTKQRDDNEVIKNFPQPKPEYSPVVKDGFVEGIDTDIDCFI